MVSISKLLKSFNECYRSYDVLSVVYQVGGKWYNIMTSVYLSNKVFEKENEVIFDARARKIL